MLAGAAAGVAYWMAFYPANMVGSQMRANHRYALRTFTDAFTNVYRMEGYRGLYRGWCITTIRAVPAHALIFTMYEQTICLFR